MRSIGLLTVLLALAAPAAGQHRHSPYAGQEEREIKAISGDELRGLLAGEGVGYALAAELNGVPGPKHVLELADDLGLSPAQRKRSEEVFEAMRMRALELGPRLVEVERRLDRGFAKGTIDRATLEELVAESARLSGELRRAHLQAHLEMVGVLDPNQIERYSQLRGYRAKG